MRYIRSGGLFLDLLSTLPLYLFNNNNLSLFKLLRLIRLPRLRKVFGLKESGFLFEGYTSRGNAVERVKRRSAVSLAMQFLSLLLTTLLALYTLGMLYLFLIQIINTDEDIEATHTFIESNDIFDGRSHGEVIILILYFTQSTMAKVGYGDYLPISNTEKVLTIVLLIMAMVFFSYVVDNFLKLLLGQPKTSVSTGRLEEQDAVILVDIYLSKIMHLRKENSIPYTLKKDIKEFMVYYHKENRLNFAEGDFFYRLPKHF